MRRLAALDRKLLRDLWSLRSQVVSIALVIGCGIGGFVATFSTHDSLRDSRDLYYERARFAHLFATVKRAPESLLPRIRDLPGVEVAEARIVRDTQLDVTGVQPPMVARLIGADFARLPALNRLSLKAGRWPAPGARGEVVVNQRFLEARHLTPGARISVLMNGKRERLTVTGAVLSPEFVYATRGGGMPDDEWFAVVWMDAASLASAYGMEGAFNSVCVRLAPGASAPATIATLDRILGPYGTLGAIAREDQVSHRILSQEISQQRVMGSVMPAIFLAVAAFILNVVLRRQVETQRGEIAALKALGYDSRTIAWHYLKFASVAVALGALAGAGLGGWLGRAMTGLYTASFHFPDFRFRLAPWVLLAGTAVALVAAFGGALAAIRSVVRLRAAEALRPPSPEAYRPLLAERLGLARLLTPAQRMVLRNLERKPLRAALAVAGVSASVAILISGTFWGDSVAHFLHVQFDLVQPAHVSLGFVEAVPRGVLSELRRLPGVQQAEVTRSVAARLTAGNRGYRTAVTGVTDEGRLLRIIDRSLRETKPAPGGVVLTRRLADRLGVVPGDTVTVHLLEGRRLAAEVRVNATVHELAGMNAWMRMDELNLLAREGPVVSGAGLRVSPAEEPQLLARLKELPAVAVVIVTRSLLETFRNTSGRNLLFFTAVLTAFAAAIAVGVVYNNARIQLAERAWELATLRVLGMTMGEVSVLMLGELALEVLAAIPLGLLAGYWLAALIVALTHGDVFEIPLLIQPDTYLYAAAAVAAAGVVSALVVRARIDRLDLVGVLKTRE
ncbi:MAG TPA: FtsX-like permease family protein [Burkholderiales bacterium]|nr:FtsX-like permease family protein [Burkholderiales bacterium]